MSRGISADALSENEALDFVEKSCKNLDISGWEIFLGVTRSLVIEAKEQKVESLVRAENSGIALRLFSRDRMGFSYATDLRPQSLKTMVERALASAGEVSPDNLLELTPPDPLNLPVLDIVDPQIREIPESEKIVRTLALENSAMSFDRRIHRVRNAEYEESWEEVFLRNSLGLDLHGESTVFSMSLLAIAEEGKDAQSGFEFDFGYNYDKLNPEEIGASASAKAVRMLGARPVSTGRYPVVLQPDVSARLVSVLAPAFSGEAVDKGRSWMKDKLGEKVFSDSVNIRDSGLLVKGVDAFPFDGEGTPSRETVLVESGRIMGFLFDRYYAKKMGCSSTGNCFRESINEPPRVGSRNFYLEPGKGTTQELANRISSGLLVEDLMGVHTADPITGEFSVGCSGIWVEKGGYSHPVMGMAMAGRLEDFFQRIEEVAGDLRFIGAFGSPGILAGGIELSGN